RDAPTEQLVEIYLGFVFALAGSVGFALGWSVLLTVSHGEESEPPKHIVSEALRLYPVAWLFGRKPLVPHALAGIEVGPADEVMVSPYAVHRNPAHWPDPTLFAPSRWREAHDRSAWLPFGAGEHTCAAVSTTFQILERVLAELFQGYSARIPQAGERPGIAAALAPPPFTLALERR
ncbi:MAG TPA: cytochrome P450, partial [Allosphingosinicella sp.]|nr:cytochrome P450 [Allosphingosinicella sp.]